MQISLKSFMFLVSFPLLLAACNKDDDNNDPGQTIDDLTRKCTFNAGITGAFTDTISIAYIPGSASLEALTSTYRTTDDELSMLSLKPNLNGAASINLFAKPGNMAVGTFPLDVFSHGTSSYYNNSTGAQNFEVFNGTLNVTKIENVPVGSPYVGQKYFSGNFTMNMANPDNDTIAVAGLFKDALLITVN